jgi:hypothetical protein
LNKKGITIGIIIIVIGAVGAGVAIAGLHIGQFFLYLLLAVVGLIVLIMSAPEFFNIKTEKTGGIGFSVKTSSMPSDSEIDFAIPNGETLNLDELSKTNQKLAEAIRDGERGHTPSDFLKTYDSWAVTWSKNKEWANVYAKPKGKDEYERYGFNINEWRWSYGENAYGANAIKKELRTLFKKEYAK